MKARLSAASILRAMLLCLAWSASMAPAQEAVPSAKELAARLAGNLADGSSFVRLKLEIKQPAAGGRTVLQLQIKARRSQEAADIVYQVLYPKERKGEAVLLQRTGGGSLSGKLVMADGTVKALSFAQLKEPLFGSDISCEDVIENFLAWDQQAIVGTEVVDRVPCQILESKPGKGDRTSYSKVKSWIDLKRLVPLRVEKYSASGQLARRIETTRVAKDDNDRHVPASLTVQRPGADSVSEFDGSNSRHDVSYTDRDFTPEGTRVLSAPGSAPK